MVSLCVAAFRLDWRAALKTKAKKKPTERTSLMLSKDDYKLLDEVREANGWSVGEATSRAVHALFAYDKYLEGRAGQANVRRVLQRVRRDVDPALLIQPKPMSEVATDTGDCGIRVGDLTFFEEDDRLFARREIGGQVEVYEVIDGRLVLRYPEPGPEFVLNLN
jgi:hypothetical protein